MHFDYLLVLLLLITLLGIVGLILTLYQYTVGRRHLRVNKKNKQATVSKQKSPLVSKAAAAASQRIEPILGESACAGAPTAASPKLPTGAVAHPYQAAQSGDLLVLYLLANSNTPYMGYELIQALQTAGLQYGSMNIFHYYSKVSEKKTSLFSVASATKPGVFDLTQIGVIICPGLCLFMSKVHNPNPAGNFEQMLFIARQLERDLGGTLCDAKRQSLMTT